MIVNSTLLLLALVGTTTSSFYCPQQQQQQRRRRPNRLYRPIAMNTNNNTPTIIDVNSNNDDNDKNKNDGIDNVNNNHNNNNNNNNNSVSNIIDFMTIARGLKVTPRTGWVRQGAGPRIESVADHSWRITLMTMIATTTTTTASSSSSSSKTTTKTTTTTTTTTKTNNTIDTIKCIKMALVHDLAEATVGDITPYCGINDVDKHKMELIAMKELTNKLVVPVRTTPNDNDDGNDDNDSSDGDGGDSNNNNNNHSSSSSISPSSSSNIGKEIFDLWMEYENGTTEEAKLVKDMDKLEMTLQALEYELDGKNQKSLDGFFDSTRGTWRTSIGEEWGNEIESRRKKKMVHNNANRE